MILNKFGLQTASYIKWISDDTVLGGTVFENTTLHHIDRNISSQCRPEEEAVSAPDQLEHHKIEHVNPFNFPMRRNYVAAIPVVFATLILDTHLHTYLT